MNTIQQSATRNLALAIAAMSLVASSQRLIADTPSPAASAVPPAPAQPAATPTAAPPANATPDTATAPTAPAASPSSADAIALYTALAASVNGAKGIAYTSSVTLTRPNPDGKTTSADTFDIAADIAQPDRYRLDILRKGKPAVTITTTSNGGIVSNNFSKKYAKFEAPDTFTGFIVGFGRACPGLVSDNTAMAVSSLQNIDKDRPFDVAGDVPADQVTESIATGKLNGRTLTKLIETVSQGANKFYLRLYIDKDTLTPVRFEQEYVGGGLDVFPYREDFTSWTVSQDPLPQQIFEWTPPANAVLYTAPRDPKEPVPLAAGAKAPDFIATTSDGKQVRLSDYAGQVVVVDFWATWCGPCQLSLPVTNKLATEYAGKVTFLGICTWDDKDAFTTWLKTHENWAINFAFDPAARDNDKSIAQSEYNVTSIPTQYIIGPDGKIDASTDYADPSDRHLRKLLDKALAGTTGG